MPRFRVSDADVQRATRDHDGNDWFISFMDITSATNERTIRACALQHVGVGHSAPCIFTAGGAVARLALLSLLNSFVLDYVARQKVGGVHLTYNYLRQLPIPRPSDFGQRDLNFVIPRACELTCASRDLSSVASRVGIQGAPFRWDDYRRLWLRAELDAFFFHKYGVNRDDVGYIMEAFPIVKRHDEEALGLYRTRDAILEVYDDMARCSAQENTYISRLDPPPSDTTATQTRRS